MDLYQIRQCNDPECAMRYPMLTGHPYGNACPACRGETRLVMERALEHEPVRAKIASPIILEGFLDNIRSAWNVGSMLRSADGAGLRHLYLAGLTPHGNNPKVIKTALGAEKSVGWSVHRDGLALAHSLRAEGRRLWGLESDPHAVSISRIALPEDDVPVVLVVGNEIVGIDPEILGLCEAIISLPMVGEKRSYNAAVAFGIAAYTLAFSK